MDEDYIEFADEQMQTWAIEKTTEILEGIRELMEEHEELNVLVGIDTDSSDIYFGLENAAESAERLIQKCKDGVVLGDE